MRGGLSRSELWRELPSGCLKELDQENRRRTRSLPIKCFYEAIKGSCWARKQQASSIRLCCQGMSDGAAAAAFAKCQVHLEVPWDPPGCMGPTAPLVAFVLEPLMLVA